MKIAFFSFLALALFSLGHVYAEQGQMCSNLEFEHHLSYTIQTDAKDYDKGYKAHLSKVQRLKKALKKLGKCSNRVSISSNVNLVECFKDSETGKYRDARCAVFGSDYFYFSHNFSLAKNPKTSAAEFEKLTAALMKEGVITNVSIGTSVKY